MDKLHYKKTFFISLIFIALGVIFNTVLKESVDSLGTVFIALGGLFMIISFAKKRKSEENNK